MANVLRTKSAYGKPAAGPSEPENFFTTPDKGGFFSLQQEQLFTGEGQLSCDVYQDKDNIVIKSTMAGVDPKNLDISVTNDLLTIRGFRETDEEVEEDDYYCRECYWGAFSRSIVLPQEVDQQKIRANLKNGVLTIKLPKKHKTSAIKINKINE